MINTTWEPSDVDIAWSKNLIAIIKPGGIWSTKDGRSVYKLDHANNNLIAIKNNNPELHKRICIVFALLGWTVDSSPELGEKHAKNN